MLSCPKCKGQLFRDYYNEPIYCLQCGYTEEDKIIIPHNTYKWENRQGFHYKDNKKKVIIDK